jgi:hypothetical protein
MKKAKIRNGRIEHVWPFVKTLPDGTKLTKNCPYENRGKPLPDCIVDVPDNAKRGLMWDGKKLSKPKKKIAPAKPTHDVLWDVVAERLGMSWDELKAEGLKRK